MDQMNGDESFYLTKTLRGWGVKEMAQVSPTHVDLYSPKDVLNE